MPDKHHLPVAAALPDLGKLPTFEAKALSNMADECARWLETQNQCRASIVTPAARTLWTVLVESEVEEVARTHRHLLDALASRNAAS